MLSNAAVVLACLLAIGSNSRAEDKAKEKSGEKGAVKWEVQIPAVAADLEAWQKLVPALMEKKMYFGALAAARNMLNLFGDLSVKELAYKTIIDLIDLGYPFSTRPLFIPGDIEPPATTEFGRNYVFYKGMANMDKKMQRWADEQFRKLDKESFAKYVFYQALQQYGSGKLDDAVEGLKKAMSLTVELKNENLSKKIARTMARIHYEKKDYEKALDIYQNFLLKTNPVTPGDWLEAAWCLYGLKRYPESLGMIYSLQSSAAGPTEQLEQYVLRALIYREYCSVETVEELMKSFNERFGKIIDGIKLGEPIVANSTMVKIEHPETLAYRQAVRSLEQLARERTNTSQLPRAVRPLANWLYSTDIQMLKYRKRALENDALQVLAKHLLILSESLRFLRFDVVREKFNPQAVFAEEKPQETVLIDSTDDKSFRLHWPQWGDFWRDERLDLKGLIKNRCAL